MNLEALLVGWFKAGIIGWAVWFVAAVVYVCVRTGLSPEKLRRFIKGSEHTVCVSVKSPLKDKVRIVARIVIWPWGLIEVTSVMNEDLRAAGCL